MKKYRLLIIDDDTALVIFLRDILEGKGHIVYAAYDGLEGLELARKLNPNLILLDIMMPKLDGYEVCRRLKDDPRTSQIPILMLTAKGQVVDRTTGLGIGADDYLPKPCDKRELEARVEALLRRVRFRFPVRPADEVCTMELLLLQNQPVQISLRGADNFATTAQRMLDIDERAIEAYVRRVQNACKSPNWRFQVKDIGEGLDDKVFGDHIEVSNCYSRALGEVSKEADLHIIFKAPRPFLRLPLEFAYSGPDYLVLRHPVSRCVTENHTPRLPISATMLNSLMDKRDELRILLVASNTDIIEGVDEETVALDTMFRAIPMYDLNCKVTYIPTYEATYERVRSELFRCQYHIFHYAGHGHYHSGSTEKSCLYFWERPNRKGEILPLRATELAVLLRDSDLRFAYLSCCLGAEAGPPAQLLDDDFLGIADGIIQAGVPAVLGYLWPVSDDGAKTLALTFYESLAKQGQIDTALLDARCEVAARDRDDITWLSPILIMQA